MVLIANRYEPTGNAAWGGISEVHECRDTHLDRLTMLKRVKTSYNFQRLLDEKKALLALRSKHVVELIDIVKFNYLGATETGLILEKIEGNDLIEGSLAYGRSYLTVLWQIASGLSDVHDAGIIHRDIKPSNIRQSTNGVIKILDFGLAREAQKDAKTKSIIGTQGYMAPELRGRSTIAFTSAIDVYAFGITALTLLAGSQALALANKAPDLTSVDVTKVIADASVATLIAACLATNPLSRPKIHLLRDEISRLLLFNKHRAQVVFQGKLLELNSAVKTLSLKTSVGALVVEYDGFIFRVQSMSGEVFCNNVPIIINLEMPSSCVITFGADSGKGRAFVTFDVSRPEVSI